MATELLCYQLSDDETRADALKQAIEEHDSPELVRVQHFSTRGESGMWVRDNLVRADEMEKAKFQRRYYRDDRSTFQWIWSPDEHPKSIDADIEDCRLLARKAGMVKFHFDLVGKDLYYGNITDAKHESIDHGYRKVTVARPNGDRYVYGTGGSNSSFLQATEMAVQDANASFRSTLR